MEMRNLGNTGLQTAPLAFGGNVFGWTADEKTSFELLMDEGKIRSIGASNYSAGRLAEALRVSDENDLPRYETLQSCYNLYDRSDFEGVLQELCISEGIGVITYFSLGCGFLQSTLRR